MSDILNNQNYRTAKMLPAYQKIIENQTKGEINRLTKKDYQNLVGLISILEDENKQLCDMNAKLIAFIDQKHLPEEWTKFISGENNANSE